MGEISESFAKKQFSKFANAYKNLYGIELEWYSFDTENKNAWDFMGKNKETDSFLPIQYTEGIQNQHQKRNLEAAARDEYEFKFALGMKPYLEAVIDAYDKKVKKADKSYILLIGFHDFFYSEKYPHDNIREIFPQMKKRYKNCAFKEVWIINKADSSCHLVFK